MRQIGIAVINFQCGSEVYQHSGQDVKVLRAGSTVDVLTSYVHMNDSDVRIEKLIYLKIV